MRQSAIYRFIFLIVAAFLVLATPALAQDDMQPQLDGWHATLDQIAAIMLRPTRRDAQLVELRSSALAVHDRARLLAARLRPQVDAIEARLRSLEGTVTRINVRSTEIETFDRATVIIPNSSLIAGVVTNKYLHERIGRIIVPVGVSYGSNADQVRTLLLECARDHPTVLDTPEPYILFTDFGASSLDFELRAYLADVSNSLSVRSDLGFAILAALRAAGIEIPFPQRDINLRDLSRLEKAVGDAAAIGDRGGLQQRGAD